MTSAKVNNDFVLEIVA